MRIYCPPVGFVSRPSVKPAQGMAKCTDRRLNKRGLANALHPALRPKGQICQEQQNEDEFDDPACRTLALTPGNAKPKRLRNQSISQVSCNKLYSCRHLPI
jgi:hypothetical protein